LAPTVVCDTVCPAGSTAGRRRSTSPPAGAASPRRPPRVGLAWPRPDGYASAPMDRAGASSINYLLDLFAGLERACGYDDRHCAAAGGDAPCSRSARRLPHADHRLGGVREGRGRRAPRRRSDRDRCRSGGIVAFTITERAATELKARISGGEARDDTSLDGPDRILVDDALTNNQVEFRWKVARGRGQAAVRLRELDSWYPDAVEHAGRGGRPAAGNTSSGVWARRGAWLIRLAPKQALRCCGRRAAPRSRAAHSAAKSSLSAFCWTSRRDTGSPGCGAC
jgi:hypothetical protein